jgi:hypothetical protein
MAFNIRENGDTLTWVIDASKVYLQRRHCNKNGLSPLNKRKIPNGAEHVIEHVRQKLPRYADQRTVPSQLQWRSSGYSYVVSVCTYMYPMKSNPRHIICVQPGCVALNLRIIINF